MPEADGAASRHVVMLVRNPFTHDTRVEKEARTLVAAGYRVTVVADAAVGQPARERRDGVGVVRVARRGPRIPGLGFVLHEARLARVLRRLRPDVLHAHDSNALVPVAFAAWRLRTPFVYDAHDLWLGRPRRDRSRLYFALSQLWYGIVERLLVPRAAATITVSPPIVEHLRRRYHLERVALVANYPDRPAALEPRSLRELRGGERIEAGRPIVLYLGGFMGGRGLEQLVDAMRDLPDAQLVLLGDGALADPLRRRADAAGVGESVHLLPPVPPGDVIGVAASADVGVSPIVPSCLNYRYSLPNKLFQYMAAGIPVVASDFPQVRQIVEGEDAGVVVDTRDPRRIAEAVRQMLNDRDDAQAMGERGRAAIESRLNWDASARELLALYSALPK